tara:strand:- start:367 stop:468 length:102 start_codon:yes stop_codon:yes gene_type:complete
MGIDYRKQILFKGGGIFFGFFSAIILAFLVANK